MDKRLVPNHGWSWCDGLHCQLATCILSSTDWYSTVVKLTCVTKVNISVNVSNLLTVVLDIVIKMIDRTHSRL